MAIDSIPHSTDALFAGGGEFFFSENSSTAAAAKTNGWYSVGNIVSAQPNQEINTLDHFGNYRGCAKRDKKIVTTSSLSYNLTIDEWSVGNLALAMAASDTTDYTATANAAATTTIDFTSVTWSKNTWYDLADAGVCKYGLTAVASITHTAAATTLTEDTGSGTGDYEVDLKLGRVRFLTTRTESDVVVTFSYPTVTSTDDFFFNGIIPLAAGLRSGMGRLVFYDCTSATNNIVYDHRDFKCDIIPAEISEINGASPTFGTLSLEVSVDSSVPGVVYVRGSNG